MQAESERKWRDRTRASRASANGREKQRLVSFVECSGDIACSLSQIFEQHGANDFSTAPPSSSSTSAIGCFRMVRPLWDGVHVKAYKKPHPSRRDQHCNIPAHPTSHDQNAKPRIKHNSLDVQPQKITPTQDSPQMGQTGDVYNSQPGETSGLINLPFGVFQPHHEYMWLTYRSFAVFRPMAIPCKAAWSQDFQNASLGEKK